MTDDNERRRRRAEEMRGAVERRSLASVLEVRSTDGRLKVGGPFTTFDQGYDMGSYEEWVSPKALDRTLAEQPDVVFWVGHGENLSGLPLARTRSAKGGPGTLVLSKRDDGGYFEASLDPEDPDAQALVRAIRNGNINACSFAFRCNRDSYSADGGVRTLEDISLHGGDVSAVASPANPNTSISVRSAAATIVIPDYTSSAVERLAQLRAGVRNPVTCTPAAALVDPYDHYKRRLAELRRG